MPRKKQKPVSEFEGGDGDYGRSYGFRADPQTEAILEKYKAMGISFSELMRELIRLGEPGFLRKLQQSVFPSETESSRKDTPKR